MNPCDPNIYEGDISGYVKHVTTCHGDSSVEKYAGSYDQGSWLAVDSAHRKALARKSAPVEIWNSYELGEGIFEEGFHLSLEGAKAHTEDEVEDYYGKPVEWKQSSDRFWIATYNEDAHTQGTVYLSKIKVKP